MQVYYMKNLTAKTKQKNLIMKELKLSDRLYLCTCGNWMDRDLNAASNIREEARRMLLAG